MNKRQRQKTNTKQNKLLNRYYKARVKDIFRQLRKRQLTVQNITLPGGYFVFITHTPYTVVHFEIKEIPYFKFGIWFDGYDPMIFGEHKASIDKFKPSATTFSPCTEYVALTDDLDYIYHHDKLDWDNIYDRIYNLVDKPWTADWSPTYIDWDENDSKLTYEQFDNQYVNENESKQKAIQVLYDDLQELIASTNSLQGFVIEVKRWLYTSPYPSHFTSIYPVFIKGQDTRIEGGFDELGELDTKLNDIQQKFESTMGSRTDIDLDYTDYCVSPNHEFAKLINNKSKKTVLSTYGLSKKNRYLVITENSRHYI